jgi:hypothetical protein
MKKITYLIALLFFLLNLQLFGQENQNKKYLKLNLGINYFIRQMYGPSFGLSYDKEDNHFGIIFRREYFYKKETRQSHFNTSYSVINRNSNSCLYISDKLSLNYNLPSFGIGIAAFSNDYSFVPENYTISFIAIQKIKRFTIEITCLPYISIGVLYSFNLIK